MSGYDQFFKAARKNKQEEFRPVPRKKAATPPRASPQNNITAEQLRARMRPRLKKTGRPFPWGLTVTSFILFAMSFWGFRHIEQVDSISRHIEFNFLGKAIAEEKSAKPADGKTDAKPTDESKSGDKPDDAKDTGKAANENGTYSPEQVDHFAKLNERKKELDAREAELARGEQELKAQQDEMDKRLKELTATRAAISKALEERVQTDEKKVDTLVEVYSNMKPQQAAKIFESMDEDLAVEILGRMKKKSAAEIMNLIKPEKAQVLTEKYAGYKRKTASTN